MRKKKLGYIFLFVIYNSEKSALNVSPRFGTQILMFLSKWFLEFKNIRFKKMHINFEIGREGRVVTPFTLLMDLLPT